MSAVENGWRPREGVSAPSTESSSSHAAPSGTPPDSGAAAAPDLPDIVLSPTPLSRSPLAAVYRGWDRAHRCDVFVKVQRVTDDTVATERFRREAAVMGRLRHPNIVALYRFFDSDPAALVMEFVPGTTLAALIEKDGWLPPVRAAGIIENIAAALDCAHAHGIVHRDVKPSNILLPRRGEARLTDFGVAHLEEDTPLTVMGDMLGTIEYASPEQVHGNETPDARSDVYSLAAVAYFALTATPPFRAADNSTQAQLSVMHRQVFAEPPPLRFHREDLSPAIEQAVLRGLQKAPEARYPSAGQFAAALRAAAEADLGEPQQRAMAAASRRTGTMAGALVGGTLLLLAVIGLWKSSHGVPPVSPLLSHPALKVTQRPPQTLPAPVPPKIAPVPPKIVLTPPVPTPVQAKVTPPPFLPSKPIVTPPVTKPSSPPQKMTAKPPVVVIPPKPAPQATMPVKPTPPKKSVVALLPPAVTPPKSAGASAHPASSQAVPPAKAISTVKPVKSTKGQAWLYVYAHQNIAPLGHATRIARIPPQAIYVDGRPFPRLAPGHWAALRAGRHVVSFFPDPQSGFSPRTRVPVTIAAGDHLAKQIVLPAQTVPVAHPAAIAKAPSAAIVKTPSAPKAPAPKVQAAASGDGWLYVYGVRYVNPPGAKPEIVRIPAETVVVDGRPMSGLAGGQWTKLASGSHVLTLIPRAGLEAGSATITIHLTPRSHLLQQVPLPALVPPHLRND